MVILTFSPLFTSIHKGVNTNIKSFGYSFNLTAKWYLSAILFNCLLHIYNKADLLFGVLLTTYMRERQKKMLVIDEDRKERKKDKESWRQERIRMTRKETEDVLLDMNT